MGFSLSANINNVSEDFQYIVTANARRVLGSLIADFNSGIHSFTIIGTYGTGKSSFLMALERDMLTSSNVLYKNKGQLGYTKFKCINIVGEYDSLQNLLCEKFELGKDIDRKELFSALDKTIERSKKAKEFLLIVIDEFGKILEHAANNNPEKEMYFLQQFAEYVNRPKHGNVMLLTTLHQNFGAYAHKLTEQQRNEWTKVKGRFKDIVFSEPVEQLLCLSAEHIGQNYKKVRYKKSFERLLALAKQSKAIGENFDEDVAAKLYPLDMFAAVTLTQAFQRYGQNERSLFSFLMSKGENSLHKFTPAENKTYALDNVYDYILYNFSTYLSEVNADSSNWTAMKVALERAESVLDIKDIPNACAMIKAIGLCNLFLGAKVQLDARTLTDYSSLALGIEKPDALISRLEALKIIRFAKYKSQYILFEGTDINIEDELYKAAGQIPRPVDIMKELNTYFDYRVISANASYYKTGTPRFFTFYLSTEARQLTVDSEVDGYINLVFPSSAPKAREAVIEASVQSNQAVIYVLYGNVKEITDHIYEIQKLEYVKTHILVDDSDKVAGREIANLISYEKTLLNNAINQSLTSFSRSIEWYYKGEKVRVDSLADFNKLLSRVCDEVYYATPVVLNELFNRQRINSTISLARMNLLNILIDENRVKAPDLGFSPDSFPPEKSVYYTLLKQTGIHAQVNGEYVLQAPTDKRLRPLWDACEEFLKSSITQQRKVGDLVKILSEPPFKLKQGFLDFWVPIYLIAKKQDYSLYSNDDIYIPTFNKEVVDLLLKSQNNFKVKAFAIDGIKLEFFNQYRKLINLNDKDFISRDSFLETIKPFLIFYKNLNNYAKKTTKFDSPYTVKFRSVLEKAKDPEETFFTDIPAALGFKKEDLTEKAEFMAKYQDLMMGAIRELRSCYQNLIERIRENVLDVLGMELAPYAEYKKEIEKRFKGIKPHLLSTKQRNFLNRVIFPSPDEREWYESICFIAIDKPLHSITDNEEPVLIDSIRHLFNILIKFIPVSALKGSKNDEVYNIEMASTKGTIKSQSFVLPQKQKAKTDELEAKIDRILSGDDNLDICTLLRILNKKING